MRFKLFDTLRSLKLAGSAALLAVTVALAAPAHAADASGDGAFKVTLKWGQTPDPIKDQYYLTRVTTNPQWTPGGGVFQYFNGNWGEGSIYWRPGASGAYWIYGAIMQRFRAFNFENFFGYPITDEMDNWSGNQCGVTVQRLQYFSNGYVICWNSTRGAWHKKY